MAVVRGVVRATASELRYRGSDKVRRANALFNDTHRPMCPTGKLRRRVRFVPNTLSPKGRRIGPPPRRPNWSSMGDQLQNLTSASTTRVGRA